VDEGIARLEGGDFAFVVIYTDDAMPNLSEADCRYQAHVSRSDDCNLNWFAHI
jgi:hypothetical protein